MESPEAARPARVFELKEVPVAALERRAVVAATFCGLATFVVLGATLPPRWLEPLVGLLGLATIALTAGLFVLRWLRDWIAVRREVREISLDAQGLHLPGATPAAPRETIPLEEIFSIEWSGRRGDDLLIGCRGRMLPALIRAGRLVRRGDIEALSGALRGAIAGLSDGAARLRSIESRAAVGRGSGERARVTPWLVGLLVVVHLGTVAVAFFGGPIALRTLTARFAVDGYAIFVAGQWYRLVTGMLLHADVVHLMGNMIALALFGGLVEGILGRVRLVIVLVSCGLFASFATAYVGASSIGASGAIFGVVGLLLYLNVVQRERLPASFRLSAVLWVGLAVLMVADSVLVPHVDWVAHLAGLVSGLGAGPVFVPRIEPGVRVSRMRLLAGVLGSAFILAAGGLALQPRYPLCDPGGNPTLENNRAWLLAIDPETRPEDLARLRSCMRELVAAVPAEPLKDTLAQLHYRLGEIDAAIELERTLAPDPVYASQLARFEWARLEGKGNGGGRFVAPPVDVEVIEREGDPALRIRYTASDDDRVFDAVVSRGGALMGLTQIYVPADPAAGGDVVTTVVPAPVFLIGAELSVVHLGEVEGDPPDAVTVRFWPLDPAVAALP